MTAIARGELRSYKQLPQIWYQIQTKFRDEPRPKSGLLRVRQFTMKDSYSFDVDAAGLDASYEKQRRAYCRIFNRCGLDYVAVEAHSGAMGGTQSQEFMVRTDAGEDLVAACPACRYAANIETASSRLAPRAGARRAGPAPWSSSPPRACSPSRRWRRPPHGVEARRQLKTLVYMADEAPVVAVVRGDQELNEAKLQTATGASAVRPAQPEEIPLAHGRRTPARWARWASPRARVFVDRSPGGADGHGHRRQRGRLPPARRGRAARRALALERRPGRPAHGAGGRGVPALRGHARRVQGARGRAHLQARHQVLGVHGRHRAEGRRPGGAHRHGQLRHRRGAHHGRGHRAAPRPGRHRLAARHRALPRHRAHAGPGAGAGAGGRAGGGRPGRGRGGRAARRPRTSGPA